MNMQSFKALRYLSILISAGAFAQVSGPDVKEVPDVRIVTAPLVAPGAYAGTTTHTKGIAAWESTTTTAWAAPAPEIKALARTLGSDRLAAGKITANDYALAAFNYVRSNIAIEFRYGLSKGARGAIIDQSGTAFDQAELMLRLLKVTGNSALASAQIKHGTISFSGAGTASALSVQKFAEWTTFVTNPAAAPASLVVDAAAACQFLADGGIPATVNGAGSCASASGNVTSISMAHAWVYANGITYDPAFKEHTIKAGVDLKHATGCDIGTPCRDRMINGMHTGYTAGTSNGVSYIDNPSMDNVWGAMNPMVDSLFASIIGLDRFSTLADIVGGRVIAPVAVTPGATLSYAAESSSWSEVPDGLRTKVTIIAPGSNYVYFADELAGRRLSYTGGGSDTFGGISHIVLDGVIFDPSLVGTGGGFEIQVDHPYPANGGTYADDKTFFYPREAPRFETGVYGTMPYTIEPGGFTFNGMQDPNGVGMAETGTAGSFPITFVGAFGDSSTSAQQQVSELMATTLTLDNSGYNCRPSTSTAFSSRNCGNEAQTLVAASVNPYRTLMDRVVAGVTKTAISHHHTVGIIFSSRFPGLSRVTVHTLESIASPNADAATRASARSRAFDINSMTTALAEGAAGSGDQLTADDFTNFRWRVARRFYNVTSPSAMTTLLASSEVPTRKDPFGYAEAAGFESWRKTSLQTVTDKGYSVIVPNGGDTSFLYATDARAYTIWEYVKGATAPTDPTVAAMRTAEPQDAMSLRRKEYSISLADGSLTFSAQPDIVSGSGDFPTSLPFQRTYRGGGFDRETYTYSNWHPVQGADPGHTDNVVTMRGGIDTDAYGRLGGGWTHNYNVTAAFSGNSAKAMCEDYASECSVVIGAIAALNELYSTGSFDERLTGIMVAPYIHTILYGNVITVKKGTSTETFISTAGGWYPSGRSAARVRTVNIGSTGNYYYKTAIEYTGAGGDVITFTSGFIKRILESDTLPHGSSPSYKADSWVFPDGRRIDFDYQLMPISLSSVPLNTTYVCIDWGACSRQLYLSKAFVLQRVRNNQGRSLTFGLQGYTDFNGYYTGQRITSVTDETNRHADFGVSCARIFCDTFTATDPTGKQTKYEYAADANSPDPALKVRPGYRLRRWFTPGNTSTPYMTFKYDELYRVVGVTDILGRTTTYLPGAIAGTERRKLSTTVSASDANTVEAVTQQVFDEKNNLVWLADPLNRTTSNDYDGTGLLTQTVFPEGNKVKRDYDLRGNLLTVTNIPKAGSTLANAQTSTTYWEAANVYDCVDKLRCNKPKTETDALGNVIATYDWTAIGQLQSVTGPSVTITDENNNTSTGAPFTQYCYTTYASGASLFSGKVEKATNTSNRVTTYTYYQGTNLPNLVTVDPANSLNVSCGAVTAPGALNLVTTLTFDSIGNLSQVDGPLSGTSDVTTFSFDPARRITRVNAPMSSIKRFTYDADGLVSTIRSARVATPTDSAPTSAWPTDLVGSQWQTTTNGYDAIGNLTSVTDDEGNVTASSYDAMDRKVLVTDADLRQVATVYDPASQVSCLWRGGTGWTLGTKPSSCAWTPSSYTGSGSFRYVQTNYTGNGKTDYVLDADNNKTQYQYDGLDRLRIALFPSPTDGTLCAAATTDGTNPTCNTSLKQTFEKAAYNSNGFRTSFLTRKGDTISFTPDVLGRMQQKSPAGQGTVSYGFNLLGQQTRIAEAASGNFAVHTNAFTYDAAGRKATEINDGRTVTSTYSTAGKRTGITWPDSYAITYAYDALGRMSTVSEGATELARYCYNTLGQRSFLLYRASSPNCTTGAGTTNKVGYTYEPDGDLDLLTNVLNTTNVTMDFGRNKSHQITTDVVSNAFYLPKPASATAAYVPNPLNQYSSIGAQAATYDLNGNMLTWVGAGGTNTYTYDSENRLITAAVNGASTPSISYDYDPLGRRVSKTVSGTTTTYLLDGDEEIAEYSGTMVLRRYITGPSVDERIAFTDGSLTPTKTYYHTNHQGSVIAMTNSAGTASEQIGYNEYGLESPTCPGAGSAFRYTGRRFDPETCLYYYRARYYTPQLGRFLQIDPIGYASDNNLYAYGGGDPVNRVDPTGTDWFNLNDHWEWHKGKSFVDNDGNKHADGYARIVVVARLDSGPGRGTFQATLYNQNKAVASQRAWSGGAKDHPSDSPARPIDKGNYSVDTGSRYSGPIHKDSNGQPAPRAGLQTMPSGDDEYSRHEHVLYGDVRAQLRPMDGQSDRGLWFHGQYDGNGVTHGCLTYGRDRTIIDELAKGTDVVPFAVDTWVQAPSAE